VTIRRIIPALIATLIVIAVVGGFLTLGSPEHQRRLKIDAGAIGDIRAISSMPQLNTADRAVPEKLRESDLLQIRNGRSAATHIRYQRINAGTYELCTIFLEPSSDDDYRLQFTHAAGPTCYTFARAHPAAPIKTTNG
jgi:hypothetical protein